MNYLNSRHEMKVGHQLQNYTCKPNKKHHLLKDVSQGIQGLFAQDALTLVSSALEGYRESELRLNEGN